VSKASPIGILPVETWLKMPAQPLIIAGPCSAESESQVMHTAQLLADSGRIAVFRAGIWKPRTRPTGFQGAGEEGLKWLRQVKQSFGMPVAVEVATPRHAELALKYDIDIFWIGARTVVNPFSVEELTNVLKGVDIPVLVKNPVNADLQLWIGALERISRAGIKKIAAVHRGFFSQKKTAFRNEPLWEIPIELKRLYPELPVITDPSHIAGRRDLIQEVCQKALDLQMNGLMIEVHIRPEEALTDNAQQITPNELIRLLNTLILRKEQTTPESFRSLESLRDEIDQIDHEIINALARRMDTVEKIGYFKKENDITILQIKRWSSLLEARINEGVAIGLDVSFLKKLLDLIHHESISIQNRIMNNNDRPEH